MVKPSEACVTDYIVERTMLAMAQYSDGSALVRQRGRAVFISRAAPLLALIIRQGIEEGVFTAEDPDQTNGVILSLIQDLKDAIAAMFPSFSPGIGDLAEIVRAVAAYTKAIERTLDGKGVTQLFFTDFDLKRGRSCIWGVQPDSQAGFLPGTGRLKLKNAPHGAFSSCTPSIKGVPNI